jgi:hypothetical protein
LIGIGSGVPLSGAGRGAAPAGLYIGLEVALGNVGGLGLARYRRMQAFQEQIGVGHRRALGVGSIEVVRVHGEAVLIGDLGVAGFPEFQQFGEQRPGEIRRIDAVAAVGLAVQVRRDEGGVVVERLRVRAGALLQLLLEGGVGLDIEDQAVLGEGLDDRIVRRVRIDDLAE